jgi:hypothetical protein
MTRKGQKFSLSSSECVVHADASALNEFSETPLAVSISLLSFPHPPVDHKVDDAGFLLGETFSKVSPLPNADAEKEMGQAGSNTPKITSRRHPDSYKGQLSYNCGRLDGRRFAVPVVRPV